MERPLYINWLVNEEGVTFEDGVALKCYKLSYETDEAVFDDWALHIRKHYVEDDELTDDSVATGLSIEDYLRKYIVPQKQEKLGPTARSNDISEILFADLFEFVLHYEVPRCKQYNRSGKNESEHGTDIIAYKFHSKEKTPAKEDELIAIEVKARLSSKEICKTIVLLSKTQCTIRYCLDSVSLNFKCIISFCFIGCQDVSFLLWSNCGQTTLTNDLSPPAKLHRAISIFINRSCAFCLHELSIRRICQPCQ